MADEKIDVVGDMKSSTPPMTRSETMALSDQLAEMEVLPITLTEEAVCFLCSLVRKLAEPLRLEYSDSKED